MNKISEVSERLSYLIDYQTSGNKKKFAESIGYKPQVITNMVSGRKTKPSYDVLNAIITTFVDVNADWLLTGEGEMLKTEQKAVMIPNDKGIPLIPLDAMAGFGTGSQQLMEYDTECYVVPEFTELNVDYMIRVKGSSMYPKYNSGDIVACKKLSLNDLFFQWNKVYVLDTSQGPIIKRIDPGKNKEHITLKSDNENYKPFELHLSQINAIALVVGVIRLE